MLSDISTRLQGEEDVQRMLDGTLDSLLAGFSLRTGWIFLEDEKDRKLRLAAHRGISTEYLSLVRSAASASACAAACSRRAMAAWR